VSLAGALLAGCGGSQPPIGAPGAMLQTAAPAAPVGSAKYRVLYSFNGDAAGGEPQASLVDVDGTLYGTTGGGGAYAQGTVFAINISGEEKVLHSFGYGTDGVWPLASLIDVNGTLYGTTVHGGGPGCGFGNSCGTVFSITRDGKEKVLHSFGSGTDGWWPFAGLTDVNGTLYGTTADGGAYGAPCGNTGCGTVFSISTKGSEKVLHSFGEGNDGELPYAGLIAVNGRLYGTTAFGGSYDAGTVFSISTTGKEQVLHSFDGADGARPIASLIGVNGTLFGTTSFGGVGSCENACGTVFSISRAGQEKVVLSFNGADGAYPQAGLVHLNGRLYGTTMGGAYINRHCSASGCGTLFSVSPSGNEVVLHNFGRGRDGYWPNSALIDVNGTLYGTTPRGGALRQRPGTVFALTP
jgi:uncharacterized repeat protein (TIGR03803 family)